MKSSGKIFSIVFCVAALFGAVSTAAKAATVIDDSKNPTYLFSMSAVSGSFDQGELTLNGVPLVVYFTDRPYRKAGHYSLEDFAKIWKRDSEKHHGNPPNGELAIYHAGGDAHAVLIVSDPKIGKASISFKVKVFHENVPKTFGHATLFIDAIPTLLGGQITD